MMPLRPTVRTRTQTVLPGLPGAAAYRRFAAAELLVAGKLDWFNQSRFTRVRDFGSRGFN